MSGLRERWHRYWFAPTAPTNLGVSRVLFFAFYLFQNFDRWDGPVGAPLASASWQPISFFRLLPEPFYLGQDALPLFIVWKLLLLLSCLGLFTRVSTTLSFLLTFLIVGEHQLFGKVGHSNYVAVLVMAGLALSRCGDAISLDALRRRQPPAASPEYTWPSRIAQLSLVMMFCAAGLAKLLESGLEWAFSDHMSNLLTLQHYKKPWLPGLGLYAAQVEWLCQFFAASSLFFEFLAPLALFSRRVALVVIPTLFLMQAGIALMMGVHVRSPAFGYYVFWVPWSELYSWMRRYRGGAQPLMET